MPEGFEETAARRDCSQPADMLHGNPSIFSPEDIRSAALRDVIRSTIQDLRRAKSVVLRTGTPVRGDSVAARADRTAGSHGGCRHVFLPDCVVPKELHLVLRFSKNHIPPCKHEYTFMSGLRVEHGPAVADVCGPLMGNAMDLVSSTLLLSR